MSILSSIVKRQLGLEKISDYDVVLQRLKCYSDGVYRGITPNPNAPDFTPEPPVCACRFCSLKGYEEVLALANEDGNIALQNTAKKGEPNQQLEGTQAHRNAIFDVAWMPHELKLVTASGDHTACLWDVSGPKFTLIRSFHAHTRSVKNAAFRHADKAVFATGARDGAVMIWDIRASHSEQARPDNSIMNAHSFASNNSTKQQKSKRTVSRSQSITGLVFQDDFSLISCAAGDGVIKVWDLRKNYSVHKKEPVAKHVMDYTGGSTRNGFTSLLVCPAGITLYASCLDNTIYSYNISSYNPKPTAEFFGHQNSSFYVKTCLSPDGQYLASGSSDVFAYIWHTSKPGSPILRLSGHLDEVTCIAWCSVGETKIVTCSDDSCHRIWRVGLENKSDDDRHDLQGQAETLVYNTPGIPLETTPKTLRRRGSYQDHTSGSDNTPGSTPGLRSGGSSLQSCESFKANESSNSLKRNYFQMSTGSAKRLNIILSPIEENHESSPRRIHTPIRGARRLFSPVRKVETHRSDEAGPSSTSQSEVAPFSPTSNLPNFVIDGKAPHLLEMSPRKCKENIDWLTKIRKERYGERVAKAASEKAASPKGQRPSVQQTSRSKSSERRKPPKSPAGSLLNFFRPNTKDCNKEVCTKGINIMSQTNSVAQ